MRVLSLLATAPVAYATTANPIRRVVTLLQEMQEEISAELSKERDMHEKFACYCKKNDGELGAKAKEAAALIKKTKAEVAAATALKKQLAEELKKHKAEREEATKKLEAATAKRKEEKSKFDEATKEHKKTLSDLDKAIAALEKGMGKAFLQSGEATQAAASARQLLRSLADDTSSSSAVAGLDVSSQQMILSFISSSSSSQKDYASQSGEIVGILKMIKQNIDDTLGGVVQEEESAVKSFGLLKKSLEELIKTSGMAIEKKSEQKGEAAVKVVEGKNLVSTTEKQMGDDMATLAALKEACSDKADEFDTRQADGAAEIDAINQAIGVLNNDDALELFKATDTKAFIQKVSLLQTSSAAQTAVAELKKLASSATENKAVALLAFSAKQALTAGKAVDFSKIFKMIDDMVALLKQEAADDLSSRDSCNVALNENAAESKETQTAIKGHEAAIEDLAAAIEQRASAIAKNTDDIAAAKEAMAGASKQRMEENTEFLKAVELNKEAVELIMKAKDKLNSYYNPDMVRKQTNEETAEEAAARASAALVQAHVQAPGLPEGQPEIFEGPRKNKAQKGGSVLSLMDMLANDLNKDTDALTHGENTAQRDYEKLSQDLAKQQVESSKALNAANKGKADAESEKQTVESTLSMKQEELADIMQTTQDLHAKCDFILGAFDERAAARESEISGLTKAKAVLAGAKFE